MQIKKMGSGGLKLLKVVHLLSAVTWAGAGFSLMLMVFFIRPTEDYAMLTFAQSLKLIDDWLIITGAVGCVITGLIYGIWTRWGFFKHRWIAVKWILSMVMMISGTFAMGPCVNGNVYPLEEVTRYTDNSVMFWDNLTKVEWWGSLQLILIIFTVVISVYKPWKKNNPK